MTTIYQKSKAVDFNNQLNETQLQNEINADPGIAPNLLYIGSVGDVVDIVFDVALSATELSILDNIIANYVPAAPKVTPELLISADNNVLHYTYNNQTYHFYPKFTKTIIISNSNDADYSSLKAAIAANPNPGSKFILHPGTYIEDNPIVVPPNCLIASSGTAPQTNIVAANPNNDLFVLGYWVKLKNLALIGASGAGARGVVYDGAQNGSGVYSFLSECLIVGCDIGMETYGGPDILIAQSVMIMPNQAGPATSTGVYAHSGGQFIALSSVVVSGIPGTGGIAVPINYGYRAEDAGSKISLSNCGVHFCTHGVTVDNDAFVEFNLIGATYNINTICVLGNGTKSKLRAALFRIDYSFVYDISFAATSADIGIFSGDFDTHKINNPNNLRFQSRFHDQESGMRSATVATGDLRFGSKREITTLNMGEGKYDNTSAVILTNTNLEVGTWADISTAALDIDANTFNIFAGTAAGNCCYLGRPDALVGVKVEMTTATSSITARDDIVWEYYDGTGWVAFNVMVAQDRPPLHQKNNAVVSYADKYHVRFGLTSATNFADYSLNGITKKWVRMRVVNALSSIPSALSFRLHVNTTKINATGFMSHFGDARNVKALSWSLNMTEPANANPADQDILLSDRLAIGRKHNKFASNTLDRIGFNVYLPPDLDTSFPVKLKFAFIGDSSTPGDVQFTARWDTSVAGVNVYRTITLAPSVSSKEKNKSTLITVSASDTEYRGEIDLDVHEVIPDPETGDAPILWVSFARDSSAGNPTDTYTGNIALIQFTPFYVSWRSGGNLLGF